MLALFAVITIVVLVYKLLGKNKRLRILRDNYNTLNDEYASRKLEIGTLKAELATARERLYKSEEDVDRLVIDLMDAEDRVRLLLSEMNKPKLPKKGASKKLTKKLAALGKRKPSKSLVDKVNGKGITAKEVSERLKKFDPTVPISYVVASRKVSKEK